MRKFKLEIFLIFVCVTVCESLNASEDNPYSQHINISTNKNQDGIVTSIEIKSVTSKLDVVTSLIPPNNAVAREYGESTSTKHYTGIIPGNCASKAALSINNQNYTNGFIFDGKVLLVITYYKNQHHMRHVTQVHGKSIFDWGRSSRNAVPVHTTMAIVIEHAFFQLLDQSTEKARDFCISLANIVNSMASQLNIVTELRKIETWTEKDKIDTVNDTEGNGNDILYRFGDYFNQQMDERDSVDFAILLKIDYPTEGKSRVGTLGNRTGSAIIVRTDPYSLMEGALTLIHELLHLIGVQHDQRSNDYIMAATATNPLSVMLTNDSVIQVNNGMPGILGRLRQKDQQWTPINITSDSGEQCSEPSGEPVSDSNRYHEVFYALGLVVSLIGITCAVYCWSDKLATLFKQEVAFYKNIDPEYPDVLISIPPNSSNIPKTQTDPSSLADSGLMENQSVGTVTPTSRQSSGSPSSGRASLSRASFAIVEDSS